MMFTFKLFGWGMNVEPLLVPEFCGFAFLNDVLLHTLMRWEYRAVVELRFCVAVTLLFIGSCTLHEFGHAVGVRLTGQKVLGIYLTRKKFYVHWEDVGTVKALSGAFIMVGGVLTNAAVAALLFVCLRAAHIDAEVNRILLWWLGLNVVSVVVNLTPVSTDGLGLLYFLVFRPLAARLRRP